MIDGLVGEGLVYRDFKRFVVETHDHKESIFDDMAKLLDMRIKELAKKSSANLDTQKNETLEFLKTHEKEINYLGRRVGELADDMENMMKRQLREDLSDEDEQNLDEEDEEEDSDAKTPSLG